MRMNAEEDRGRQKGGAVVPESDVHEISVASSRQRGRVPDEWNEITRRIIGCAMEVHSHLGPGLLERIYEDALFIELQSEGLAAARQVEVVIDYKGMPIRGQRLDLVIENLVVIELNAVEAVADAHLAQLVSYLRAANLPLGLLINFKASRLKDGIYRRLNERALPVTSPSPPHP